MENENERVKLEDTEEEGSVQDKKHGFASHSPGRWDQDEMISINNRTQQYLTF